MTFPHAFRGIGLALLSLAFLMPGHYLPWASFQGQWVAAFAVALLCGGAAIAAGRSTQANPFPPMALLAFACACIPPLQYAARQLTYLSDATLPAAYFAAFGLALITGAVWSRGDRAGWLDHLFAALLVGGSLSVAIAMLQWLSIDAGGLWRAAMPPGQRPFANLGQPNHLALLLCVGFIATLRAHERGQLGGASAGLLSAWLGFGLAMTQSRTGWLIVTLLVAWWLLMKRRAGLKLPVAVFLAGALLFALLVLSWDALNQALLLAQDATLTDRMQGGTRPRMWSAMVEAVSRSPWLGYGFNQVSLAQQAVAVDMPAVHEMFESSHNIVLDLAVWAGLPVAMLWVASVVIWLATRIRACRAPDDWFVLAAVGAILTHAMLEYPLEHTYFMLPLGLFMGSAARAGWQVRGRLIGWPLGASVLAMTALLFVVGTEYLRVESASHQVRLALFGIGDPSSAPPPDVHLLDAPREYHRLMLTPARAGMTADEIDWMKRVMQRHAFPPAMMRYALAAGLNGRPDDAALTLRRFCRMHAKPRCAEAREAWGAAQQQFPQLVAIPAP